MNDGAKASTSSDGLTVIVDGSSGEVKQCVKSDGSGSDKSSRNKDEEKSANTGTGYTAKDLERVTRKCVMIENAVGMKKMRLDKIGSDVKMLIHKKRVFDEKIESCEKEYMALDSKGIELNSTDFRQKCYLLCKIAEMINERCDLKKQLADYNRETSKLNKEMYECENGYKTNIYLKEKIKKFFNKK